MAQVQSPPAEPENPYLPPGPPPIIFDTYIGINTRASRPGIADEECYWMDGWMPFGKNNMRTLPGIGPAISMPAAGLFDVWFDFGNIASAPLCIALLSDGSLHQINTATKVETVIAPPGTIVNVQIGSIDLSQWGSQYILIVAEQTNGYFIWDGVSFYAAGGLAPPVVVTAGGTGYSATPTITASGGSGSGATFSAVVTGGIIISIAITNPGTGYKVGETVTLAITDSTGTGATATVTLMPFGIKGNAVETYTARVWIADGPTVTFSAPETPTDFSSASGGGNFTSTDSFLRRQYTGLRQSNGFLYLVGDSSVNYLSGVQTSGSPTPTTTFTNQNADPEIGTPFSGTIDVFSRNILFANAFGAHVSYGGAVTKISEALDGVYATVPNFGGLQPTAGKAIIFGQKVWILLLPVIDLVTGQRVNKLFLWNEKKWFSSPQEIEPKFIQHQEIDSVITCYGTNGNGIYPLFQQPSVLFKKTVQSKLWDRPGGYMFTKTATRLWGLANYNLIDAPDLFVSVDNEFGSSNQIADVGPNVMTWVNDTGATMTWTNDTGETMEWFTSAGIAVFKGGAVGQTGVLTGLTITTFAADMSLISMALQDEIHDYRG